MTHYCHFSRPWKHNEDWIVKMRIPHKISVEMFYDIIFQFWLVSSITQMFVHIPIWSLKLSLIHSLFIRC